MHDDLGIHRFAETRQRKLERRKPDRTPRAGDIGDKIDSELLRHVLRTQ